MLFNSIEFIIFFPIVVCINFILSKKMRVYWLLIASYFFYMSWNPKYAVLILFSTTITYFSGIFLDCVNKRTEKNEADASIKKIIVAVSVLLNLGVLGYFKYTNFLIDTLNTLFSAIHVSFAIKNADILLPVGISFYTFQALSYTIDVYRNETEAEKSFVKYALFVSFFPQLVAGPIERSKNLLNQLSMDYKFDFIIARDGFMLMLWGYFQKLVVADRIAELVDGVYADYEAFGGISIIIATVLFAIQIYCDFSGYSLIAVGAAKIMGVKLMENFDAPYLSTSVAEFWRRWHISLTSWFKDYIYIPLGGSRKGKTKKYLNIMIVFLVSGLWHGASFHFVLWGALNGIYQVVGEITTPLRNAIVTKLKICNNNKPVHIGKIIATFILVDFAWLFFRAESVRKAFSMLGQIFTNPNLESITSGKIFMGEFGRKAAVLLLVCFLLLLLCDMCKKRGIVVREWIYRRNDWVRPLLVAGIILFILVFGVYGESLDASQFVYFQF